MTANQTGYNEVSGHENVKDQAARTVDSLGAPISVQEPSRANKGAGVILSILFFIGGLALVWVAIRQIVNARGQFPLWAQRGDSWIKEIFVVLFGSFLIGCGMYLWRLAQKLFSLRVVICERGFCVMQNSATDVFAWDDIILVDETILHERLPIVKGPAASLVPTKASRIYTVTRRDGKTFIFNPTYLENVDALATPLTAAASQRNTQWRVTEQTG